MYPDLKGTLINPLMYQGRWIIRNKEVILQTSLHWREN